MNVFWEGTNQTGEGGRAAGITLTLSTRGCWVRVAKIKRYLDEDYRREEEDGRPVTLPSLWHVP
jgi:hypothetical protein